MNFKEAELINSSNTILFLTKRTTESYNIIGQDDINLENTFLARVDVYVEEHVHLCTSHRVCMSVWVGVGRWGGVGVGWGLEGCL